ncbi:MAG TPA: TauD/TfdA family dioxygenase [Novosphingobium sp.]
MNAPATFAPPTGPALLTWLESRASSWMGATMSGSAVWREQLSEAEVDEFRALVARGVPPGKTLETLTAADLPLPTMSARIAQWRQEIDVERGFLLVQRLPVEEWTEEQATIAYMAICTHMGQLRVQNSRGTIIGHVRDEGVPMDLNNPKIRINETNSKIRFHVDFGDVVGLLCLHNVANGGLSRIVSSHSVIAEVLRQRPDLEETLFGTIPFDALDMIGPDGKSWRDVPVCRWRGSDLRVSFQADTIDAAQQRGLAPKLTAAQADMVRLIETIAEDPRFHLDMYFEVGELQFINNNHTLHSRTSWDDVGDPQRRRHLLRAWIVL